MKKILLVILKYVLAFGIAGFLLWLSLRGISEEDKNIIHDALGRAQYWLLLPVCLILFISHWIRCLRWRQLIFPLGFRPPMFDLLCALCFGLFTNLLIPRAGEIIRCTVLSRQHKIPVSKLIGTIIAERAFDVICLLLIAVVIFFAEFAHIHDYLVATFASLKLWLQPREIMKHWAIALIVVLLITIIIIYIKKRNKKLAATLYSMLKGFWEGLSSIRKVKNKPVFFLYSMLIWFCYIMATYVGRYVLQETIHLNFGTVTVLLVTGTIGMIVAPGGIGAYPYALQKTLIVYGINKNIAIAFGWLLWVAQFIFTVIFGILAYIAINIRNKKYEEYHSRTA